MPFVTEEIWHWLNERHEGDDIIISHWPEVGIISKDILGQFDIASDVISNIRNIRKQNNIANKVKLELSVKINGNLDKGFDAVIRKMGNLSGLEYVDEKVANAYSFIVKNNEYFIPFGDNVDLGAEKQKIEDELEYAKGSLAIVQKKLSNEKFVSNAPEQVVAGEKKKEADALEKIKILEEKLASLN